MNLKLGSWDEFWEISSKQNMQSLQISRDTRKKKNLLQFLKEQGEPETRLHNTQGIQSRWFLSLSGCGVPSRKENLKDGMWAQWIQMIGLFKVLLSLKL